MNALLYRFLAIAMRTFGLLLIVAPIALLVAETWLTLTFPPKAILEYVDEMGGLPYPYWGASYLLHKYFFEPVFFLTTLAAWGVGLWMILSPLSWRHGVAILLLAVPCFFVLLRCIHIFSKVAIFL